MQVSEQSWHLRYVRFMDASPRGEPYVPRDLCSYFWTVVALVALPTLVGLAVLTVIVFGGFQLYEAFRDNFWTTSLIVGIAIGIPITITAVILAIRSIVRWRSGRPVRVKKPKRKKEPGLVRSYLSAKKRRVCPLIEVVE